MGGGLFFSFIAMHSKISFRDDLPHLFSRDGATCPPSLPGVSSGFAIVVRGKVLHVWHCLIFFDYNDCICVIIEGQPHEGSTHVPTDS